MWTRELRTIIPRLVSCPRSGAATRLRTPALRMLSAAAKRASVWASRTSAAWPFCATSRSRLRETRKSPVVPGSRRLAARSRSPSGVLRKIAPSSGRRCAKARSRTSSRSSSSEIDAASALWTSLRRRIRSPDSRSAAAMSSEADRSSMLSDEAASSAVAVFGRVTASSKPSMLMTVSESFTRSPTARCMGVATGRPFRRVVLREPRSSMNQVWPSRKKRACSRERKRSERTRSAFEERPTTRVSPSQKCSNDSPIGGVMRRRRGGWLIWSRRADRRIVARAPFDGTRAASGDSREISPGPKRTRSREGLLPGTRPDRDTRVARRILFPDSLQGPAEG